VAITRGFVVGLIVGLVAGAGGAYLALERPWTSAATPSVDAGVAVASADGGAASKGKGKGKRRRGGGASGAAGGEVIEGEGEGDTYVPPPVLTAADKAMSWKGDAVSLPPRTLDMASADEGRPLDSGEINGVLHGDGGAIVDCIGKARGAAELEADITVKMLVGGDGRVTASRVRAPAYLFDHGLLACAQRAARGLRFPATGAPTVVDAPFELSF
jgi:hypothetical protein